jgi:hypothetical protein
MRAFEATTGVRLRATPEPIALKLFRRWRAPQLPHVDVFDSEPVDGARFGGPFRVRVWHRDDPDRGVQDEGLQLGGVERGPDAGKTEVAARARRANVEVMFLPETIELDAAVQSSWETLTAFLDHL